MLDADYLYTLVLVILATLTVCPCFMDEELC